MVGQEIAVTVPERVERLALMCTSAGGAGGSSYPLHELIDLSPEERARLRPQISDSRFDEQWLASHPRDKTLMDLTAPKEHPSGSEARRGEIEQLNARRGHDVWDRLPAITCPTLVACGRYDGTAPAANSAAIASRIPGAELHTFEGGHLFFVQDRSALPVILDFLSA
jgi:pimeloyl-ACP methyl ester carboxylesterase